MNGSTKRNHDEESLRSNDLNHQLETPALSPATVTDDALQSHSSADEKLHDGANGVVHKDIGDGLGSKAMLSRSNSNHDAGEEADNETTLESRGRPRASISRRGSATPSNGEPLRALKLSPRQIQDLTNSPRSLPFRAATPIEEEIPALDKATDGAPPSPSDGYFHSRRHREAQPHDTSPNSQAISDSIPDVLAVKNVPGAISSRPSKVARAATSPVMQRKQSTSKEARTRPQLGPLKTGKAEDDRLYKTSSRPESQPSPMPTHIPIPPISLPTYLQLELSSDRPSALYIHRSTSSEFPYESSKVKFDRLVNFFWLPFQLEQVLWFGALACLDAWLYTFTILPLRFFKAVVILLNWWGENALEEVQDLATFVYNGLGRLWTRRHQKTIPSRRPSLSEGERSRRPSITEGLATEKPRLTLNTQNARVTLNRGRKTSGFRHRRTRSTPSALMPNHKADILQGLLVVLSCMVLVQFDASRMYHSIRGQAAIKLYVIYNVLEVFDRLFSALGQDVLECLFSKETLERNADGRSKVIRPLWMFLLALVYNVIHSTALFYQVVTLNVAVNSYSNALLTLLMSNQFVEIKGTVFKKFEKENLFQLTCADVVERFQLWLMLLIIALRNIVEVGGLSISLNSAFASSTSSAAYTATTNVTGQKAGGNIIPHAFTIFPRWTGEVLGPFLIVLGSEMLVDWLKHAYITKFNNVKPNIYGRFLDVLAKDYYTHAFADQDLTKRLGLPVIPLSCLFIRASMQTYHMFVATHVPLPIPSSSTSIFPLDDSGAASSQSPPSTTAALQHIDHIFRRALGRSTFGAGGSGSLFPLSTFSWWSLDDIIALATMGVFFLAAYFVLLALKLVLGMVILKFARDRYAGMKEREGMKDVDTQGKRIGGWGVVEVGEDKRRWIYEDDPEGLRALRERERAREKDKEKDGAKAVKLEGVQRYSMAAKRIW
ncbi:DUF747-domain-containing protein [Polychaeton citri CBS 116435]|uniref:DUF747-domain-containing protein n=1 Tax=Polychaeton citri CBS 116435 TaxID=1314669 RepID=A0A9P4UKD6_9PEZI|nr:DUF747-domain-containing protein [Polychaeton citri CBS 116435]